MKKIKVLVLMTLVFTVTVKAQFSYSTINNKTALGEVVNFSEKGVEYDASLMLIKAAHPSPATPFKLDKAMLDAKHLQSLNNTNTPKSLGKADVPQPIPLRSFRGNAVTQSTPNDNDIAISNAGIILSAVNTNINILNDTGRSIASKTLQSLPKNISNLNRTYDPRVLYDPEMDRFILVFMQGSTSRDTRIIVGFSQSNDPNLLWNFYTIPGNIFGDSSWSDYPIISISNNELFLTVNRLKDNTYWKNGFIESFIWQMDKDNGYKGDTLNQKVYYNIKYNDKPIWSICPAKGGAKSYGPNMFFFSVRPDQLWNDTVFVHEVTNTIKSGKAALKLTVLKADKHYGLQPNAFQPNGKKLQTNDARILSAMAENGIFYLVGNCVNNIYNSAGFYLITIEDFFTNKPVRTKLKVISSDTMDYGYPSIAYCGGGYGDNSAMITCSHVSPRSFAGTSLVYVDRDLNPSVPLIIKPGESNLLLIGDSVERWGDYTGIQLKYNEKGKVIFNGSYMVNNDNKTWIGIAKNPDTKLNTPEKELPTGSNFAVYPVPTKELMHIDFSMAEKKLVHFVLVDMQGKETTLLIDNAKAGINRFTFNTSDLAKGIYQLLVKNGETAIYTQKIVVAH